MSTAIMEAQLLGAINGDPDLAARGCRGISDASGGVRIARRDGQNAGIWFWRGGRFELIGASRSEPIVILETVAEVVHYSREHLCPPA